MKDTDAEVTDTELIAPNLAFQVAIVIVLISRSVVMRKRSFRRRSDSDRTARNLRSQSNGDRTPQTAQGPPNGGGSNGRVSRSGLVLPVFVLLCPFWDFPDFFRDFPDLLGNGPGIFPIRPFSLSRPTKSTYEEQSRKGPRHNLDLPRNKWETPPVWKTPGLASLKQLFFPEF